MGFGGGCTLFREDIGCLKVAMEGLEVFRGYPGELPVWWCCKGV